MDPKTQEALALIGQLCDQTALTKPQRQMIDAALFHLTEKLTPAPKAPAPHEG
jgi:hypothetical protein